MKTSVAHAELIATFQRAQADAAHKRGLIHKMAQRLNSADELIEILMRRDPKARVILGLSREANVQGEEREDGSVLVRMNRHTLSDELGLSEEDRAQKNLEQQEQAIAKHTLPVLAARIREVIENA